MAGYGLENYDGVLAYGKALQTVYESGGQARKAWTWHEAADTRVFTPLPEVRAEKDLVWVGNWGDGERTAELKEFLILPVKMLSLKSCVYGVRYPPEAKAALADAGIHYAGWLPNFEAPRVFAQFKMTVHVPRSPYVHALPGIPTIRVFEALACGIALVCSPWDDVEGLFEPGKDFLVARNAKEMARHLRALVHDQDLRRELARNGLRKIRARHTCAHRVDELMAICSKAKEGAILSGERD
jgi:spore maturation protein CgeB